MSEKKYTKLSLLVGDEFTVQEAYGFSWKKWDAESKRMLLSETYEQGFRKIYTLVTDKGNLDVGSGQLGTLLEAVYKKGKSDLVGRTFQVSSNGKSGMDVRYYFKPTVPTVKVDEVAEVPEEEIDLSSIPF